MCILSGIAIRGSTLTNAFLPSERKGRRHASLEQIKDPIDVTPFLPSIPWESHYLLLLPKLGYRFSPIATDVPRLRHSSFKSP
jgi:hypothetical protein